MKWVSEEPSFQSWISRLVAAVTMAFAGLLLVTGSAVSAEASNTPAPKTIAFPVPVSVSAPHILSNGIGMTRSKNRNGIKTFDIKLSLINSGKEAITIVGFGRSGPGLKLLLPERRGPYVLLPGEEMALQLPYKVTDCEAAPRGRWPVPVRVLRPTGEQTVYLKLVEVGGDPWDLGGNSFCGSFQ
jgi:hypothetical protein